MLLLNIAVDSCHLLHVQFARQHHHIGKLCVETQCLGVGDVQLRREMHLYTLLMGILHGGDVAGDDSTHARGFGIVHYLAHQRQVFGVHHGVQRQVGLHSCLAADTYYLVHILCREVGRRTRTHIQVLNTKIDAGGSCLYSSRQRLPAPHRRHDFYI